MLQINLTNLSDAGWSAFFIGVTISSAIPIIVIAVLIVIGYLLLKRSQRFIYQIIYTVIAYVVLYRIVADFAGKSYAREELYLGMALIGFIVITTMFFIGVYKHTGSKNN